MCTTVLKSIKSIHNQTDSQGQQQQIASRQHSQVSKQQKQQHSEKRLQKSQNDFSCMMNWRVNSEFSPFLLYFLTVYWYNNRVWMVVWREKDKRQRTMHRDILSPDDVSGRVPCRTSPEGAEDRPFSLLFKIKEGRLMKWVLELWRRRVLHFHFHLQYASIYDMIWWEEEESLKNYNCPMLYLILFFIWVVGGGPDKVGTNH